MVAAKGRAGRDSGFTLIEMLVVIIILAVLAAIAIPVFLQQRSRAWDAAVKSDLKDAATAEESYLADHDQYAPQSPAAVELTSAGFRYSDAQNYWGGTAAIQVATDPATLDKHYCLSARSASGRTWAFDNSAGGLQPDGSTC